MAGFSYLTAAHLQGFDRYKYRAVDTSPLSIYVIQPILDFIVSLCPMWLAPNLLTLTGWLFSLSNFLVLSCYDWHYTATTADSPSLIPAWVWLYCCFAHFLSYILDGIDGKQARRTGNSTPVGELFDHGLDSWAAIILPMCLASGFGRWLISTSDDFWPSLAALGAFYVTHWEKYITGVMYLPWLYDIMQLLERGILYAFFAISLVAHIHYGVSVVQELCGHFNIYTFSLEKKPV